MAFSNDFTPSKGCTEQVAHRVGVKSAAHNSEG